MNKLGIRRGILQRELNKCKPASISKFNRIYGSVDEIPADRVRSAYDQIQRTLSRTPSLT